MQYSNNNVFNLQLQTAMINNIRMISMNLQLNKTWRSLSSNYSNVSFVWLKFNVGYGKFVLFKGLLWTFPITD